MIVKSTEVYSAKASIEEWQNDRQAIYRYKLLECEKEIEISNQYAILPCYGIEIIREDLVGGCVYSVERDSIECMTTYKYKAAQLLKRLYDNCASPVHLIDIAGPIADEWVSDFDDQLNSIAAQ